MSGASGVLRAPPSVCACVCLGGPLRVVFYVGPQDSASGLFLCPSASISDFGPEWPRTRVSQYPCFLGRSVSHSAHPVSVRPPSLSMTHPDLSCSGKPPWGLSAAESVGAVFGETLSPSWQGQAPFPASAPPPPACHPGPCLGLPEMMPLSSAPLHPPGSSPPSALTGDLLGCGPRNPPSRLTERAACSGRDRALCDPKSDLVGWGGVGCFLSLERA